MRAPLARLTRVSGGRSFSIDRITDVERALEVARIKASYTVSG